MLGNIIADKASSTQAEIARLAEELKDLEKQGARVATEKGIEKWLGNSFESSSITTPEFAQFVRDFKKHIIDNTGNHFELVNWSRGHFEVSGFLKSKDTDKLVYFSISDVRFWPDAWYNHILIRTAQHDRDYTGGTNCYTSLSQLLQHAITLTK